MPPSLRIERLLLVLSLSLTLGLASIAFAQATDREVTLRLVQSGFSAPTDIQSPSDGTHRLFVVEQAGTIRLIEGSELHSAPFLDIRDRVRSGEGEEGLLGLAFPPGFSENPYFYVNYTATDPTLGRVSRLSRFALDSEDQNRADPTSETVLLTVPQPFSNHNAGQLQFGPEGYLYVGMGDGGSGGDPGNRAQDPSSLLGKMLRIDVESNPPTDASYTIPEENPFLDDPSTRDEIWALGLRNPWRYSFDAETGDLFIADVGQNSLEEINVQPAVSPGGQNYGWRRFEGTQEFDTSQPLGPGILTEPVHVYGRSAGRSVTGGYVYRGFQYPRLRGDYIYGDFISGRIWSLQSNGENWENQLLVDSDHLISTFGVDSEGELYLAAFNSGNLYQVIDSGPYPLPNAAHVGEGWRYLSWFGAFRDLDFPWVYHEGLGWVFASGLDSSSIWLFLPDLGWHWTSRSVFPYLFRQDSGSWFYFGGRFDDGRYFYNFENSTWESIP